MKTVNTPGVGTGNWIYLLMIILLYGASHVADSGYSNNTIGKADTHASIKLAEFELDDQNTYEFEWTNTYKAEYMHATLGDCSKAGKPSDNQECQRASTKLCRGRSK